MDEIASFDETRLAVRTWGPPEAPMVVLVHGLGLSTESWGSVPQQLSAHHRVVAYDLRGHGHSGDAHHENYSLRAHAADLGVVLDAFLGEGQRAAVVGNSLGGGIIVAHAHERGVDQLAGVVFAGSGGSAVTFPGFPAPALPGWLQHALRQVWMVALRATARAGHWIRPVDDVSNWLVRRSAFTSSAPRDLVDRVRRDFLATRPRALSATTLASVSHDGTRMAPALTVPTLVLHGSKDPEVTDQELEQLLDKLPDAELKSIAGEGHMLPLTDGDFVVEEVTRWVRRVGLEPS